MAATNIEMTRRVLDEVWNQRNMDVIDELVARDFVFNDPMAPPGATGVEAYRQFVHANLKAFPDLRLTIEEIIADRDIVAVRWHATGTHKGDLAGHGATGKKVSITGMNFNRVVNGKFVESWGNWDTHGMMHQLGLMTTPVEEEVA
jgi:steroid delta-isomerase-like uncharacterized protein